MTQATEERERFAGQAKELAEICDKLRPGTGMAIETFLKMAYDEGWQARASEGDGELVKLRAQLAEEYEHSERMSDGLRKDYEAAVAKSGELVEVLRELDPINCQPPFGHDGECSYCGTKEGRRHPAACTWEKLKALARTQE